MRAITITADHRLELTELPEPVPKAGEVLIDVVAAGVNRADLAQAAGMYPPPAGASELPGLEVSGHRRDTGAPVVALLAGGGYAEVVAVPEGQVLPAPAGLTLAEAGGVIEAAATAVSNLVMEAGLGETAARASDAVSEVGSGVDPGSARQTVLIHGASGGVGIFAVQLAHALGARVLATVGSESAMREVQALGAELVWNRHDIDLPTVVRAAGGADIILDVVGGAALTDNVRMLREHGRLVIIGTLGGASGELPIGELMARRARVIGTTLRSRAPSDKQRILARTHEIVWPMLERDEIAVPVHARLPLAEASRAHELLRAGGHLGKVVLDVAE